LLVPQLLYMTFDVPLVAFRMNLDSQELKQPPAL
jgi:hypothetical protein